MRWWQLTWWWERRFFTAIGAIYESWLLRKDGYRVIYVMFTKDGDIVGAYSQFDTAATFNNKNPANRKCKIVPAWIKKGAINDPLTEPLKETDNAGPRSLS